MQDQQLIVILDLVGQMGRPEHGQPPLARQRMHMVGDRLAAGRVQPHGGFVQQQHRGVVDQRARNLGPAPVAAVQVARTLVGALAQVKPLQRGGDPGVCGAPRQPVQGGEIGQVAHHAQVQVQRRLLEHHPDPRQRRARVLRQVMPGDRDLARAGGEKPGQQREQRRFSRAIGPQQRREPARRHVKADRVQRPAAAIGIVEISDT